MPSAADLSVATTLTTRERWLAACEVLLASAVVLAHNVWHIVPNEVPILVVLLWVSLLVRRKLWSSIGFCRPSSLNLTLTVALLAGILLQLKDFVTEPIAHHFWKQPEQVSSVLSHTHSLPAALGSLGIVWTFAAFGEEFAYRGLLLRRAADACGGSRLAYAAALVWSSIFFGFGHFYKGPTGVFDSTISGLILGAAYLITGRNLWAPILAHGLSDTFAVVYNFFFS